MQNSINGRSYPSGMTFPTYVQNIRGTEEGTENGADVKDNMVSITVDLNLNK